MTLPDMLKIFLGPWGWPFLGYVILQVYVPTQMRNWGLFALSLLPLPAVPPILLATYEAGRMRSNLWPIALIFGGLIFAGYEVLLLILNNAPWKKPEGDGEEGLSSPPRSWPF